jgi:threonine/homoserine/homoserine lactone efflux protein
VPAWNLLPSGAILGPFLVGLIFGFAGSMPIAGPTAMVVVSRGLERRRSAGLCVAIGSAVPEAMYAFVAYWGIAAMIGRFPILLPMSRLLGCLVLAAVGVYLVARRPRLADPPRPQGPLEGWRNALLGFTMTMFNPTLIVSWTAAVGVAHSTGLLRTHAHDALPFAGGVGIGIAGWFAILLWLLERFRARASAQTLGRMVRGMGVVLIVSGVGMGARLLTSWL